MSLPVAHPGERAALDARRQHSLADAGPLDVLEVAEERFEVPVLVEHFENEQIAGVLLRRAGGDSFIGVNADHHTVRQRFTLAHELGHLHMGHQARVELASDLFAGTGNSEEVEANYFAAEFLLPREMARAWLEERDLTAQADEPATVVWLAVEFGLAFETVCYRLERAGAISTATKKKLVKVLRVSGRDYLQLHAAHRLSDTLQGIWQIQAYPRVPRQTAAYAARAHAAGLIDEDEYVAIAASRPDVDLAEWMA